MVLFLDFDGVLHEYDADKQNLLRHVPKLTEVLREYPDIDVVIDSEWRKTESLSQLVSYFPSDVIGRFVGVTGTDSVGLRQRERECWTWLCASDRTTEHWIALEDNLDNFGPDLPGKGSVLFVDPADGLDASACNTLRAMILGEKLGAHFCYERSTVSGWSLWES